MAARDIPMSALFHCTTRCTNPGASNPCWETKGYPKPNPRPTKKTRLSLVGGTAPNSTHTASVVWCVRHRYFDPAPRILATEGSSLRMSLVAPEPSCSWRAGGHALFMLWLVAHELWELNNVAYGLASFSDVGQSAIRCVCALFSTEVTHAQAMRRNGCCHTPGSLRPGACLPAPQSRHTSSVV